MEKDIGKIKKNDQSDIVIRVDDFGGKPGVTIREFVTSERYTGFTKSGVRILAEDFPKFKEMLNSVSDTDLVSPETPTEAPEESEASKDQTTLESSESKEELPDY